MTVLHLEDRLGGTRVLTRFLDSAFAGVPEASIEKLRLLMVILAPLPGDTMSLDQVDRRVDAFRASRHWREPAPTATFMGAMLELLGGPAVGDDHLSHLLQLWRYRRDDPPAHPSDRQLDLALTTIHAMGEMTTEMLGGPAISDTHLRTLIGALCRAPEDPPAGQKAVDTSKDIAQMVVRALHAVTQGITPQAPDPQAYARQLEANLQRCIRLALEATAPTPAWQAAITRALPPRQDLHPGGAARSMVRVTFGVQAVSQERPSAAPPASDTRPGRPPAPSDFNDGR